MSKMIKWPSIEQFRNVVKTVQMKTRYRGKDETGEPIFDAFAKLPTLKFEGTVKLHGTNAAAGINNIGEMWFQSRENIITPEHDNAGFAMFGTANKRVFLDIAKEIDTNFITTAYNDILIFGEWCCGNIQKGVAITGLPKMFVIFGIALVNADEEKTYLTRAQVEEVLVNNVKKPEGKIPDDSYIYSIYDFSTYIFEVDFENPHLVQNALNDICLKVEQECPVGKAFGITGIGEGIVIRCVSDGYNDSGFWAKIKGSLHSASKVKTLATVDVERINDIQALAATLAHNGRLEQGLQLVFDTLNGGEVDIKRTGEFIQWMMKDIFKEEIDTIAASGYNGKELNGPISKIARDFLMKNLEI